MNNIIIFKHVTRPVKSEMGTSLFTAGNYES